jgi:gamma-glutamyltranspeptidase/glutathione hydrolase
MAENNNGWSRGYMAAVANPYATDAAVEMLAQGGHAVDAAIAAHAVLGLVEPESSGLGGGGFMVVYEQATQDVRFLDGRETAPAGASPDMFMQDGGEPGGFLDAWQSGKAIGVPGAVALYKLAHDNYGKLPWASLFEPAIRLANDGFEVSGKLAGYLPQMAQISRLDENPGAAGYFYPDGEPIQAGSMLRNPDYANTLRRVADEGPQAFYSGEIAEAMAASAQAGDNGGVHRIDFINSQLETAFSQIFDRRTGQFMPQQALGTHDDQRFTHLSVNLPAQHMEHLCRSAGHAHLNIVLGAKLQIAFKAC